MKITPEAELESKILNLLTQGRKLKVTFTKTDGSTREMLCSRMIPPEAVKPSFASPIPITPGMTHQLQASPTPRKKIPGLISVWDHEAAGWRSFKVTSVKEIRIVEEGEKSAASK